MGREVLHARLALEAVLGAVAVVHVEIEDRHALEAVHVQRLAGADRDAVEQAEAHGALGLGVMAGRAQRAERVVGLAADHGIDRGDRRAGGAQPASPEPGDITVSESRGARAPSRLGAQHGVDVARRVHALELGAGRPRRLALDPDEAPLRSSRSSMAMIARMRAIDSGWPGPVSCSSEDGCV